jgi:predicted CXXCH cytochrome family protein
MIRRDGTYYQRRYQIGYQSRETNVEEKRIDFVMGSGDHARTYLHRTARNTLQQLPLGWYPENGGSWAMSPGYDSPDHSASLREITYECMFCHNAYPEVPAANLENGADPVFRTPIPEGIECQRCHGPGGRHSALAGAGRGSREEVRAAIVNPARLDSERQMDVCAQCHLQTSITVLANSIRRHGRAPFSFRPGELLSAFRLTFDRPADSAGRFEIVSSVYRLKQSACYRKSAGGLPCVTCHDPHGAAAEPGNTRYNRVCRQCHDRLPSSADRDAAHDGAADCVACHMPKRRTDDVVHAVMTDHYIQRRRPSHDLLATLHEQPLQPGREEAIVAYDPRIGQSGPDRLYLALAQAREPGARKEAGERLVSVIRQVQPADGDSYVETAEALEAEGSPVQALPFYREALRRRPDSAIVLRKMGAAMTAAGQPDQGVAALERSLKLDPGVPAAWGLLGQAYVRQGKNREAVTAFERALEADPDQPGVRNNLGSVLASAGDLVRAEREFRESVRIQPNLPEARANLAGVLALNHDLPQAEFYLETALRLNPDYASAHLEYARLLEETGRPVDAEREAERAVRADPQMAEAHDLFGRLLAARGDTRGALRELSEAVRISPGSGNFQLDLGVALAAAGDTKGAVLHLRLAARSPDSRVRQTASDFERKIQPH